MKTSWVLSVTDLQAKDKAFKQIDKPRKEVALKADELLQRYESLYEKGRFKIDITSPHTEIDLSNRMKVIIPLTEEITPDHVFTFLHDLNPFIYRTSKSKIFVEVDRVNNLTLPFAFSIKAE